MTPLQEKLSKLVELHKFGSYIEYIRFPFYKNLRKGTRIEFGFPITALVGPNGTNKSSVLRAVMGCPNQANLGNFWFATRLDPISNDAGNRPCFIYGYYNFPASKVVEVIKTRIEKQGDPNYWEPSRPILEYGMTPPPRLKTDQGIPSGRSLTRWNAIEKPIVYIDFRATLSAFDKFFYHGDTRRLIKSTDRRDIIISRSPHLRAVIDQDLSSYIFHKVERVAENLDLTAGEVAAISRILAKTYKNIKLIKHSFFNSPGYSAILQTNNARYSEAFAGSGEFSVVMAVHLISQASKNSLIIMDEPEVSLHPGAQDRLLDFIYEEVDRNKHQVVISTHSPAIVRKLPKKAIKIFVESPNGEVGVPLQEATQASAFFNLGEPIANQRYLVAEDRLAAEIIKRAMRIGGEIMLSRFKVVSYPGGASSLWMRHAPIYSAAGRNDVTILFDGDQRPIKEIPDPATIPVADDEMLGDKIKEFSSCNIDFAIDGGSGGGNISQRYKIQRNFIEWSRANVRFLPGDGCPEQFVLKNLPVDAIEIADTKGAKGEFVRRAKDAYGLLDVEAVEADQLFNYQKLQLASISLDCQDLVALHKILSDLAD